MLGAISLNVTSFQHYIPHHTDKIGHRIKFCDPLCPHRHAFDRCVQATKQNENHHHKKRDKHGLLLRIAISGY